MAVFSPNPRKCWARGVRAKKLSEGMPKISDLSFTLYWSFRSPYSYILLPRIVALVRDYAVDVDLRVVHPAAIRNPAYFKTMNPLARPYFTLDSSRAASYHQLPFARPQPDPVVQDPETLVLADYHPLAVRLGRLGVAAEAEGTGLAFCFEVAQLLWRGTIDWHQGEHMSLAASRAGCSLSELQQTIDANPEQYDAMLTANDTNLRAAGHWGVPTMVFRGEPFFGQDRFDTLVWRLRQCGLTRRVAS